MTGGDDGRRHERGLALIVVLWGIAALSLIAGAMLASSLSTAHVAHNAWIQVEVRTAADNAVQGAILSLFDPDPRGQPPLDGTARTLEGEGGTALSVAVQDETGLIDINTAGEGQLRTYLAAAGIGDAEGVAHRIAARQARPFQSVEELASMPGLSREQVARVAGGLTVYSHRADVDLRVAPRAVIASIPGLPAAAVDQMAAHRGAVRAATGHAYTITVRATRGGTRFARRAVVLLTGDPARPYWIMGWE